MLPFVCLRCRILKMFFGRLCQLSDVKKCQNVTTVLMAHKLMN